MNLIRYNNPIFPRKYSSSFDSLFENLDNDINFQPKVIISENDNEFSLNLEIPGINKKDIQINLEDNSLIVSGERKFESKEKEKVKHHLVESSFGSFSRTFYLPDNVDHKNIDAKYENGMLSLAIPKVKTEKIKNTIKIK